LAAVNPAAFFYSKPFLFEKKVRRRFWSNSLPAAGD
jgi:hypothetical protein